jgi:hypothetical protein
MSDSRNAVLRPIPFNPAAARTEIESLKGENFQLNTILNHQQATLQNLNQAYLEENQRLQHQIEALQIQNKSLTTGNNAANEIISQVENLFSIVEIGDAGLNLKKVTILHAINNWKSPLASHNTVSYAPVNSNEITAQPAQTLRFFTTPIGSMVSSNDNSVIYTTSMGYGVNSNSE